MHEFASWRIALASIAVALALSAGSGSVFAQPVVTAVEGTIAAGQTISISGRGFSIKNRPKPLLWWTADLGPSPTSLGRLTSWSGGWDGDDLRQQSIVAPGSKYSYRLDHGGTEAAALGYVDFQSNQLYVWRKQYHTFDVNSDYAIRTRIDKLSGSLPAVGQLVKGMSSGATAVVQRVVPDGVGRWSVFYSRQGGSVNAIPAIDFRFGETVAWDGGTASNAEYEHVLRSLNFKSFRIWATNSEGSQTYPNAVAGMQYGQPEYRQIIEGATGAIVRKILWQQQNRWQIQEVVLKQNSLPGAADGVFGFAINGVWDIGNDIVTRAIDYPLTMSRLYQSQVSNGAQPGSWVYYDSLYVDDSLHRVLLSAASVWSRANDVEVQIPTDWQDGRIDLVLRFGGLDTSKPIYLYVVDGGGAVNENGFPLSGVPIPKPPGSVIVE